MTNDGTGFKILRALDASDRENGSPTSMPLGVACLHLQFAWRKEIAGTIEKPAAREGKKEIGKHLPKVKKKRGERKITGAELAETGDLGNRRSSMFTKVYHHLPAQPIFPIPRILVVHS